jgi:hydrogenase expression/formation protein HypC
MCLGEIVRLESVAGRSATARVGERAMTISLVTLEEPVAAGDWVLSHSGFALSRLEPENAAAALAIRTSDRPGRPGPEEERP